MPKSKRKSGMQYQDWIRKYLEERGYSVENFKPISIRREIKGKEVWQRFRQDPFDSDLIAKKVGERTLWIQATLHTGLTIKKEKMLKHPWTIEYDDVQIWVKRDSLNHDIYRLGTMGFYLYGKIIHRKFYESTAPPDPY
jgi:hypothetical protein